MTPYWEGYLVERIKKHIKETNSVHAQIILDNWDKEKFLFWQIIPKEMVNKFEHPVLAEDIKIA